MWLCFLLHFHFISGQESSLPGHQSKHSVGYSIGYAYPKLALGSKQYSLESGFNYGIVGSFEWGKYYDSGISFMIAPQLYYSSIDETVISSAINYSNYYWADLYRYFISASELEFVLPIAYEFPFFKKLRLSTGADFSIPVISSGSSASRWYDSKEFIPGQGYVDADPPILKGEDEDDFDNDFNAGFGVNAKVLYSLKRHNHAESFLALEYWYMISDYGGYYGHKTRFGISYIHRSFRFKEVREKWDRYWIKKEKSKGNEDQ